MNTVRFRPLLLLSLVALSALAFVAPVFAAPPEFQTVPVIFTWTDVNATNQCGFPVQFDVAATLKISMHDLHNGTFVEIDRYVHATTTFTNLDTGTSYISHNAGPIRIVIQPDGTFNVFGSGLIAHISLPGEGLLIQDAGRFVEQNGIIIFQAGPHPVYSGGDVQGICTVLS